jgi:hypothetical protein
MAIAAGDAAIDYASEKARNFAREKIDNFSKKISKKEKNKERAFVKERLDMNFRNFLITERALLHAIKLAIKKHKENKHGKPDGREYDPEDEYGYDQHVSGYKGPGYNRKKTNQYISNLRHIEKMKGKSDDDYH